MKLSRLLLFPALLFFCFITASAQDIVGVQSLHGIRRVYVSVEDTSAEMQSKGLVADEIKGRIEGKLRAAKIGLVSVAESDAILYIKLTADEFQKGVFTFSARAEIQQMAHLARNPKMLVVATTWLKDVSSIYAGGDLRLSLNGVDKLIDAFIQDMERANSLLVKPKGEAQHKL